MRFSKLVIATLLSALTYNAGAQSCCKKPEGMQALALNKSFKDAHEAPIPFAYSASKGDMITFKTEGGKDGNAFYVPADETTDKVLIVVHEWWGLNDYIKREAERWQQLLGGKVAVYAIDLYDGQVATDADMAGKIMGGLTPERGAAIVKGVLNKIGKDKKIATIGWCMGGSWSFTASVLAGKEATGCVMYYGFPEQDEKKIKPLKTDVLYIYGTQDNFIKQADVETLGKRVMAGGHKFEMHSYNAVHAFANPSNPKHDATAAAEAQVFALKFLNSHLLGH